MSNPTPAEDAIQDFNQLRADIARLSDSVAELLKAQAKAASAAVSDTVSQGSDQLNAKISQLGGAAKQATDQAQASVRSASHDLERTINHNPLAAVLIAAGVGLVLGMISARS